MNVHILKIWPKYFGPIKQGDKTFEVRKNDRNYQVGDCVVLREYNPEKDVYTGGVICAVITYIQDSDFTPDGYTIFAFKKIHHKVMLLIWCSILASKK